MVDKQLIEKRLRFLDDQLVFLRGFGGISLKDISEDRRILYSAQLSLVYAIESILDMGSHLVAANDWEPIDSYSDIARRLFQHGVISEAQRELLISLVGFRNIVVHGYLEINIGIVYDSLRNRLGDFEQFASIFSRYL